MKKKKEKVYAPQRVTNSEVARLLGHKKLATTGKYFLSENPLKNQKS